MSEDCYNPYGKPYIPKFLATVTDILCIISTVSVKLTHAFYLL